jgi:hypothetical protein
MHVLALVPSTLLMLADAAPEGMADAPPQREEPRWKGTGLLATTGIVGGASLGVTIGRIAMLKKNCPLDAMGGAACTYDLRSDIGLSATAWSLNFANIGLATGAGVMLGRYHGWKDAGSGRTRNIRAIQGVGGGLVGVGVAGLATSVALAFVLPVRCAEKELEGTDALAGDRCLMRSFPAWTMTNWASFAMIASGGAMLAYGSSYKSRRGRISEFRLSPDVGPTYAGLGMSGRF